MGPSPRRSIGDTSFCSIGFGAMGISAFYGAPKSDEERFAVLDAAYEMGCRHWDTAAIYNDSEDLIGKWLKRTGKRNDIFLATKLDLLGEGTKRTVSGDPQHVAASIDNSLQKLGVDCVDLYYVHRIDSKIPIEVTMRALVNAVRVGKAKYLGLSECSSETLRRAHAVHQISAVQIEYSPFVLDIESNRIGLLKTCRELGVRVVAYSPLGRGLLTGRYKSPDDFEEGDLRRLIPKFSRDNFPKILQVIASLEEIASRYSATPGQVVLAWLLAQGEDIIPIPGTSSIKYLQENVKSADLSLNADDVAQIRTIALNANAIEGDRSIAMHMTFGDTPPLD